MSARDDYPMDGGGALARWEAMCNEIDRLRSIKQTDDGAYEHVVEMFHALREQSEEDQITIDRLTFLFKDATERLGGSRKVIE